MNLKIQPSAPRGALAAPPSKSMMQRACAAALIRGGSSILSNPGVSADDETAIRVIAQLGASVERRGNQLLINSRGVKPPGDSIDCGESGLSLRMFVPIGAVSDRELFFEGSGSLLARPVGLFDQVLPALGVSCQSEQGYPPLRIKGPIRPASIEIDGQLSSQFLTGLLMAYAAAGASDVTLAVKNLVSKPYIDLTLQLMSEFGLKTPLNLGYREFYFQRQSPASFSNDQLNYVVENDWSGAAFLLVLGAIAGEVSVTGLELFSKQGDRAILQALMQAGALLSIQPGELHARKSRLKPFQFNATDCPDLFPPLVALAAYCEGTSVIEGVQRLVNKESDRSLALQQEFGKMGIVVELQDQLMIVHGGTGLRGAELDSHGDHRIAMACAVAATAAAGESILMKAEAVEKSYPRFWKDLQDLHLSVSLNHNF